MRSRLFQKLAELPGVNWFNHKEKVEISERPVANPPIILHSRKGFYEMEAAMMVYFEHCVVLQRYIKCMHELIDHYDENVDRWDNIQAAHEQAISDKGVRMLRDELRQAIEQRERYAKRLKHLEEKPPIISFRDLDRLMNRLDDIDYHFMGKSKEARRANEVREAFQRVCERMKEAMEKQGITDDQSNTPG